MVRGAEYYVAYVSILLCMCIYCICVFCSSFFYLLSPFTIDKSADDKQIWFLFLVFIGVYLPELAMKEESQFIPSFEGKQLW